jgi:hypothetical protein
VVSHFLRFRHSLRYRFTPAVACNNSAFGNAQNGDYVNIVNGNQTLTAVSLGNDSVTIYFIG